MTMTTQRDREREPREKNNYYPRQIIPSTAPSAIPRAYATRFRGVELDLSFFKKSKNSSPGLKVRYDRGLGGVGPHICIA